MNSQNEKSPESAIQEGRQYYGAKRFKPALEQFTKAMKLCPCARGMKRERCSCKNYEKVALEGGSIFNEAMYTCTCTVGKTFNKCDKPLHIQALDYRAATFEALQELDRARRDAEWMLELAPRLPDGYLRLGKIVRLQKKYELAWKVYTAGIEVGNNNRLAGSSKMQKLYAARQPLQTRFYRRDPLRNPPEILQRIFSLLDFETLVRCLRVSKNWKEYLTSPGNERLWRALLFTRPFEQRYAPSIATLRKLVSYSGSDVRQLVISHALRFKLTLRKLLALLQGSRKLECLSITGSIDEDIELPQRLGFLGKLTNIVLDEFVTTRPQVLGTLLRNASQSLQSLHISGLPHNTIDLGFPVMPSLKYLRLEDTKHNGASVEILAIATKTPKLEQLRLRDVIIGRGIHGPQPEYAEHEHLWKDLKVVVYIVGDSGFIRLEASHPLKQLTSIRRGVDLQHVDFDLRWSWDGFGPLTLSRLSDLASQESNSDPTQDPEIDFSSQNKKHMYSDLRSLRLTRTVVPPGGLELILHDSIAAGKLQTLDIVFPLGHDNELGRASWQHLEEYAFVRGTSSIRNMGIFEFRFHKYPKNDDDLPLPSFLASFPNLETLEISSDHYEELEFCSVVQAIIKVTRLKTIYQTTAKGVLMDELKAVAAKSGVEMIWGNRPREWPVRIEE
ncbi:hypothetical protein G7046_g6372 [Stylonectria norvegica]|nr:hypothetical protein G7046_g6372 [Stylonectria norvegica]